jgi:hypothetical protein
MCDVGYPRRIFLFTGGGCMAVHKNRWGEEIDPVLSGISVALYGFDIYMAMKYEERIAFETSEEEAKMQAIRQEKLRRKSVSKLDKMTSAEHERNAKEIRLFELELEKVNREIETFEKAL